MTRILTAFVTALPILVGYDGLPAVQLSDHNR